MPIWNTLSTNFLISSRKRVPKTSNKNFFSSEDDLLYSLEYIKEYIPLTYIDSNFF